ncbi:FtsW/RodA/SpoVE family cell cycle protein [Hyphomonas sp.]|uniref:FtsW/RodA/SpoVE family cell cycle protein n=1 Tax=Hyphomonas sp. TaxID=87 RepID=UPI003919D096
MSYTANAPLLPRSDASWFTEWRRTLDWGLVAGVVILISVGLLMSLAAGPSAAARTGQSDPYFYIYRQTAFSAAGFTVLMAVSLLDRKWARRFAALVFLGSIALMIALLGIGHEAKGAQRWLRFAGVSLQPSEMVKPALILLCGWLLAQREHYPKGPWTLMAFGAYAATLTLLLLQPDVGQSVLVTAAFLTVFFISGLPKRWVVIFAGGGAALAFLLYSLLPYVRSRITMILNPTSADTFQIDRAAEAISRGGLLGAGPGEGLIKARLPDAHTDFILAVMAEEYGLVAILALIGVYALMAIRGFRAAGRIEDGYARTAAAGLFTLFSLQAAINIGVNLAILPPTGMTLPFVSSGGSSMVGMGLTLGLALALVRGEGTRSPGRYG